MKKLIIPLLILCVFHICLAQPGLLHTDSYFFMVNLQDSILFEQIDRIISHTDINKTIKAKNRLSISDYKYFLVSEEKSEAKETSDGDSEYWLHVSGETDIFGEYLCFYINSRCFISSEWYPGLFKKIMDVRYMGEHTTDLMFRGCPLWKFKIRGGEIVQAIYNYEELDDFQEVNYDLLKDMIISEGCMDMYYNGKK